MSLADRKGAANILAGPLCKGTGQHQKEPWAARLPLGTHQKRNAPLSTDPAALIDGGLNRWDVDVWVARSNHDNGRRRYGPGKSACGPITAINFRWKAFRFRSPSEYPSYLFPSLSLRISGLECCGPK